EASSKLGAEAYATGNSVAFGKSPTLHTAAHEAAHIVQQRSGISVPQGLTPAGHSLEKEADQVADAVVAGRSAAPLLDRYTGGGAQSEAPKAAPQRKSKPDQGAAPNAGSGPESDKKKEAQDDTESAAPQSARGPGNTEPKLPKEPQPESPESL